MLSGVLFQKANVLSLPALPYCLHDLLPQQPTLCQQGVSYTKSNKDSRTEKLDAILTSPIFGFPIMIILLGTVFYITIAGANIPSSMLAEFLCSLEIYLKIFFDFLHAPDWLYGMLVLGFIEVQRGSLV